jgi:hypothetical protein
MLTKNISKMAVLMIVSIAISLFFIGCVHVDNYTADKIEKGLTEKYGEHLKY